MGRIQYFYCGDAVFLPSSSPHPPAFAEAPARRTRLWEAGLRAGRLNSKQTQTPLPTGRQANTKFKTQAIYHTNQITGFKNLII